jgi:hypothetical protein
MDGAQDDCAVRERDDLCTLIPATRPTVIDFECEPDEAADLSALVAELRPHAGARLHLAAPAKIAAASGGRRAGSIEITTRKPKCSTS